MRPIVLDKCQISCSLLKPSARNSNRSLYRLEIDNDVISDGAVEWVGMDVRVKFDDSGSNVSRDIRGAVSNERTKEDIEAYHITL